MGLSSQAERGALSPSFAIASLTGYYPGGKFVKFIKGFKAEDRVRAKWRGYKFLSGVVTVDNGGLSYGIAYDSKPFEANLPHFDIVLSQASSSEAVTPSPEPQGGYYSAGDRVSVKMADGSEKEGGIAIENFDGTFGVRFEDGVFEAKVAPELLRKLKPPSKDKKPIKPVSNSSGILTLEQENDHLYSAQTYLSAYPTALNEAYFRGATDSDSSSEEELTPFQKSILANAGLSESKEVPNLPSNKPHSTAIPNPSSSQPTITPALAAPAVPTQGSQASLSDATIRVFKDKQKVISINKLRFFKDGLKVGEVLPNF
jgi:hypothetical protein